MNPLPEKRPPDQEATAKRRRPPPDAAFVIEQQIEAMLHYIQECRMDAALYDQEMAKTTRKPGQRPYAVVPLPLWVTIQDDGHDDKEDLMARYQARLLYLKSRGLYDGPTTPRSVNREEKEDE